MKRIFDHEKLEVYQLELRFISWVSALLKELQDIGSSAREVCNHLDRASLSSLFNTAEANGRWYPKMRVRFFSDASGSVTECAACLDALVAKGLAAASRISEGKDLLSRIYSMLCKLLAYCSQSESCVRDGSTQYAIGKEYEYDGLASSALQNFTVATSTSTKKEGAKP